MTIAPSAPSATLSVPDRNTALSSPTRQDGESRITGIDAARGSAMILVCLSHIKEPIADSAPALYDVLLWVTRIATPTFLLLSGFVIAHLLHHSRRPQIGIALVDRGLFLLFIAHLMLDWVSLPELGFSQWVFGRAGIVDAIGVSLCVAVALRRLSAPALLTTGLFLALASWPVAMTLQVESVWAKYAGALLFNLRSEANNYIDVPLVAYLGVFLIGMGLSVASSRDLQARAHLKVARRLFVVGASAIGMVAVGIILWFALSEPLELESWRHADLLKRTLNPTNKWPPSPAYLFFYGGLGLLMTALLLWGQRRRVTGRIVAVTSVIGSASLMCFIVQDFVLRLVPRILGISTDSPIFWLVYCGACVALLYVLARKWNAANGNRWFTVGLKKLAAKRGQAAHAVRGLP